MIPGPAARNPEAPLLVLDGVDAAPPRASRPVLSGVSLTLHRGEIGVLLGGNGAGKSTLLRTAAGLWPAKSGTVAPPGSGGFDPARAALVLEDPGGQLVAGTVSAEIEFALENRGLPREEIAARREEALAAFDLAGLAGRDPWTLSPGGQERCLLAAAWAQRPALLLLDDPFLYLGVGESGPLWARLAGAVRAGEIGALLLATHDGELAAEADRVGILDRGRLAAWGGPEAVLRGELPEAVEPPLGLRVERAMAGRGWSVPVGPLTPEATGRRIPGSLPR